MSDLTAAGIKAIIDAGPPRRLKAVADLTVGEHIERRRTGAVPETAEYVAYRRAVLERHGVTDAGDQPATDPEAMTPRDHERRRFGDRNEER